jgi:hypothetical protein
MKELSVKQRIQDVLLSNTEIYLNYKEIAEIGYGDGYIRDSRNALNAKISRNVSSAINELLEGEGLHVISKYLPRTHKEMKEAIRSNSSNKASETSPYKSYKIAKDIDEADIILDIKQAQDRIDRAIKKRETIKIGLESKKIFIEEGN